MKFICEYCGISFNKPPSDKSRFCSRHCYDKSRECIKKCLNCGKEFKSYRVRGRKFCSSKCASNYNAGDKHYHWKGGVIKHGTHVRRRVDKGIYIGEHRIVMEEHIGRKIKPEELVHHINGNGADNRIENHQIVSRAEHERIHKPRLGTGK